MPNSKVAGCQDEYGEVNCVGWPASLLAVVFWGEHEKWF